MVMTSAQIASLTVPYLPHICTLLAPGADSGFDDYEEPIAGTPTEVTGVACWAYQPKIEGEQIAPGRALVAHDWHVLVGTTVVAVESWQITDVRDEDDVVIVAGPLPVTEVIRHRGHKTLVCAQSTTGDTAP